MTISMNMSRFINLAAIFSLDLESQYTKYQKYVFGLKSSHLKIGANGAGAYTIPRSVSYQRIQIRILFEKYISTNTNTNTIREWNY